VQISATMWPGLVEQYHRPALNLARKLIDDHRDWQVTEDIVQSAWLNAFAQVKKGIEVEHFGSYLYTLVRRRCIDEIRRRTRNRETPSSDDSIIGSENDWSKNMSLLLLDGADTVLRGTVQEEDREIIMAAVDELDERDRCVVVARLLDGLSHRQSSARLVKLGLMDESGHPEKRAENYYSRSLAKLRVALAPELDQLLNYG
jgi:RNA polymerase sigma factor (sigma-70 family)